MWTVKSKSQDILQSTSVRPENGGGWMAVNAGTSVAVVDGYELQPGDGLDFTHLHPDVVWDSQINIVFPDPAGDNKVRLTTLYYKEKRK